MKKNLVVVYSILIFMSLISTGCKENLKLYAGGFAVEGEKGFSVFNLDSRNGNLELVSEWEVGPSPAYFCFSDEYRMIYALNEVSDFEGNRGGGVTAFKYDPESDILEKKGAILVPFGGPCFISISPDGRFLFFANYASSSVAVARLNENGIPETISDTILYETEAPDVSHPHMISQDPAGKHVYVTDLGLDRIVMYDFESNTGKLNQINNGIVALPDGSGPRHFVFNADGSMMYVINELGSSVMVFNVSEKDGMKMVQTLSTVSGEFNGRNSCADIHIGKNGNYLYGSNRGENSIVVFKIKEDGTLALAGRVPCGGDWPRNFVIDPSGKYLLAGNQRSNTISVFRINKKTGMPEGPVNNVKMKAPACLKFHN